MGHGGPVNAYPVLWDSTLGKQKNSLTFGLGSILASEDDISGKQLQLDF